MKRLETTVAEFLGGYDPEQTFNVIAHELWRDEGGWSSNDRFRIATKVTRDEVPDIARGRWEVFKVNYAPRARVSDIEDIGYEAKFGVMLEANFLPFLDIEPV